MGRKFVASVLEKMNKEIPTILDLGNTKDNQEQLRLLDLLTPLVETMTSRVLITSLNSKDKLDLRTNSFVWGYLNNLTFFSAKKISISTENKKVLLSVSLSLHSILFNHSVQLTQLEYEAVNKSIKKIKTLKDMFIEGAHSCKAEFEKIGEDVPIRNSLLPSLNIYLHEKLKELEPYKKAKEK